jgi:hypothetical protein
LPPSGRLFDDVNGCCWPISARHALPTSPEILRDWTGRGKDPSWLKADVNQYFREIAGGIRYEREIARWRRLLEAA